MYQFLESLEMYDYVITHKIVLALYIIIATLILKQLAGQKERLIRNDKNLLILYIIFFVVFAGTRANTIGTDTNNYFYYFFIPATQVGVLEMFERLNSGILFELLLSISVLVNFFTVFLFIVALVMNIAFYKFVRKFTNNGKDGSSLILFLFLVCNFSFLNLELNIIRNGLAISFILIGIHYVLEQNLKKSLLFFGIAFLFHRTTIIPFVLIMIIWKFKEIPLKYYLVFFVLAIGLSAAGFGFHSLSFLAELGNEDLASLKFTGETEYKIGFRPDFVAYNTMFLGLFFLFIKSTNAKGMLLLKIYILTSATFFLNFYIPYSDRFGLYSWVIIPLLFYNIINESFPRRRLYISTVVLISFFILNYVILFQ